MRTVITMITFCLMSCNALLMAQAITHHNPMFQPNIPAPMVSVIFTDPKFGSPVTRITNARAAGLHGMFPEYSKRQAWNADETLIKLLSGDGTIHIFDANTFQLKYSLNSIQGVQDIFWHPTDPDLVYYVMDNKLYSANVRTSTATSLFTFSNYAYVSTKAEGNMSNDGKYIALCGFDTSYNPIDFFLFNVQTNTIQKTMHLNGKVSGFDWLSVSPLGNYIIVDYATDTLAPFNGVEVFDQNFNLVWRKPLGAGHSDYGLDTDGKEVLIMDVYDKDSNLTYINKYALNNGTTTSLLSVSPLFDIHESCRAISRPGWVYISTFDFTGRLTDDSLSWLPFEDEVFALKMDGSGDVQRFAHHHSRRYSPLTPNSDSSIYYAEPHATVNHKGTKILFGSNWRLKMDQDSSVDAYLINLPYLGVKEQTNAQKENELIYPNPVRDDLHFSLSRELKEIRLDIYSMDGRLLKSQELLDETKTYSVAGLRPALYLYELKDYSGTLMTRGKFVKE